jgi:outer membrane immunogenic protein
VRFSIDYAFRPRIAAAQACSKLTLIRLSFSARVAAWELDGEYPMKIHRIGLLAFSLTSIAALAAADAADVYVPPAPGGYKDGPVYSPLWTGLYAGVNGGYGWSDSDSNLSGSNGCPPSPGAVQIGAYSLIPCTPFSGSKSFGSDGGFGGGQIGYNWQPLTGGGYKDGPARGNFVFGIEADIQGAGIDGSATISGSGLSATGKDELQWFGTVRGRIGYAFDTTLVYFTGGLAFGGVKDTLSSGTKSVSKDDTDTGYVLGGGLEHYFNPRWSGKVEYQYINLGDDKLTLTDGVNSATLDAEHKYHTIRVGLNYHFDRGYEPLK